MYMINNLSGKTNLGDRILLLVDQKSKQFNQKVFYTIILPECCRCH